MIKYSTKEGVIDPITGLKGTVAIYLFNNDVTIGQFAAMRYDVLTEEQAQAVQQNGGLTAKIAESYFEVIKGANDLQVRATIEELEPLLTEGETFREQSNNALWNLLWVKYPTILGLEKTDFE